MPEKNIVGRIVLDINILLEKLNIDGVISKVEAYGDVFEDFETQVFLVRVELDFHSDNVLALFFGIEHINCEWEVFLGFTCVSVANNIKSCLGRKTLVFILRILALDRLFLVPCLLVKLWMNLEREAFEIRV